MRRELMHEGSRVAVAAGRYEGRTGVVVTPPDVDGLAIVRVDGEAGWPFPTLATVSRQHLRAMNKPDPMDAVGEALV
jgi:hypothetical protein